VEINRADILGAFDSAVKDYEDAILSLCASRIGADYIITRDKSDFISSAVPAISPKKFLDLKY
jgi:hypothetical protein